MSSTSYPLGTKSYNNHLPQGGFMSWKGSGILSNPIALTAGNIRPFVNKDYTNNFKTGFGLPRPIKHFRRGKAFNYLVQTPDFSVPYSPSTIDTVINRGVASSVGGSLVRQLQDNPGQFNVFENKTEEVLNTEILDTKCSNFHGIGLINNYYPNNTYLTDNPDIINTNKLFCCNAEQKALRRVMYASTNLKKNYFNTHRQYMQNRCQTYEQRAFNFKEPIYDTSKPGSPASITNIYQANCQPNAEIYESTQIAIIKNLFSIYLENGLITQSQIDIFYSTYTENISIYNFYTYISTSIEYSTTQDKETVINIYLSFISNPYYGIPLSGILQPSKCNLVVYKPNNYKYASQGAVSSSSRTLRLTVNTIDTNYASLKRANAGNINILKQKTQGCKPSLYTKNGNPKTCFKNSISLNTNKIGLNSGHNGYKLFY